MKNVDKKTFININENNLDEINDGYIFLDETNIDEKFLDTKMDEKMLN